MIAIRIRTFKPSFKGLHNSVRCKVWLALYDLYLQDPNTPGITTKNLAIMAGVNPQVVYNKITQWEKWRYVVSTDTHPMLWKIKERGIKWLKRWYRLMPIDRYISEINEAKNNHTQ